VVRRELQIYRGEEVRWTGDGFLATFDRPANAILCACRVRDAVRSLGIEIRSGMHMGAVEWEEENVGGIAVHIGARVAAHAAPSEVLVSSTIRDAVEGSGFAFEDRGVHELKGVPGSWTIHKVLVA
jgi:class 3 adenylate cyclase